MARLNVNPRSRPSTTRTPETTIPSWLCSGLLGWLAPPDRSRTQCPMKKAPSSEMRLAATIAATLACIAQLKAWSIALHLYDPLSGSLIAALATGVGKSVQLRGSVVSRDQGNLIRGARGADLVRQ